MAEKKRHTTATRGATRTRKATTLSAALLQQAAAPPSKTTASDEPQNTVTNAEMAVAGETPERLASVALKEEMRSLREQLASKTAEYRLLIGNKPAGESKTVARVLELLSEPSGATKGRLADETGAKKGYIDALLGRILPSRGYVVSSSQVDGTRVRFIAFHR